MVRLIIATQTIKAVVATITVVGAIRTSISCRVRIKSYLTASFAKTAYFQEESFYATSAIGQRYAG